MLTKKDEKFFLLAKKMANSSTFHNIHIGCVLVYKGKVIGTGCNSLKTHPDQKEHNHFRDLDITENEYMLHSIHAEMKAIHSVKYTVDQNTNWSKVKVYIYRVCVSRRHGLARPCPACMAKIKEKGIKHIYYTTDDGYAYEYVEE